MLDQICIQAVSLLSKAEIAINQGVAVDRWGFLIWIPARQTFPFCYCTDRMCAAAWHWVTVQRFRLWTGKYAAVLLRQEQLIWSRDRPSVGAVFAGSYDVLKCCITTAIAASALSYLSSETMFAHNFYTLSGISDASNWLLQFLNPRQWDCVVPSDSTHIHIKTHTVDQWATSLVWLSLTETSTSLLPNFGREDREYAETKECLRWRIDLDRWPWGQEQG